MTPTELVKEIDHHQRKYPARYSTGATMSYKQFRRMTNFIEPGLNKLDPSNIKDAVKFVSVQTKINRVLSQKGLKLKSRNYYNEWYIAEDSGAEVNRMQAAAIRIDNAAERLRVGIARNKCNPHARLTAQAIIDTAAYINAKAF